MIPWTLIFYTHSWIFLLIKFCWTIFSLPIPNLGVPFTSLIIYHIFLLFLYIMRSISDFCPILLDKLPFTPLAHYDFLQLGIFYTNCYRHMAGYHTYPRTCHIILPFPQILPKNYFFLLITIFSCYSQYITVAPAVHFIRYILVLTLHYFVNILHFSATWYISLPLAIFSCHWQNFARPLSLQDGRTVNYLRWLCETVFVIMWDDYLNNHIIMVNFWDYMHEYKWAYVIIEAVWTTHHLQFANAPPFSLQNGCFKIFK